MKNSTRVWLGLVLLGAGGLRAAEADRPRTYAEAVVAYVDAATVQLRALRGEVDALKAKSGEPGRPAWVELYLDLDECDAMVARLRVVGSKDFDGLKAKFERVRGEVLEALAAAKKIAKTD
jgi:hypothetical protein